MGGVGLRIGHLGPQLLARPLVRTGGDVQLHLDPGTVGVGFDGGGAPRLILWTVQSGGGFADGSRDAGPPGADHPQAVVTVSLLAAVAAGLRTPVVLLVAGEHLVLDEPHDVREGEGLLADAAGQDVLVAAALRLRCNKRGTSVA